MRMVSILFVIINFWSYTISLGQDKKLTFQRVPPPPGFHSGTKG